MSGAEAYERLRRLLEAETRLLVQRLRGYPTRALDVPAGWFPSRTAAARHLAQRLADVGQGVEERARPAPPVPRLLPALPAVACADMVAVTAADLVSALTATATAPDRPVWLDGAARPAALAAAVATAEVLLHRHQVDRAAPGRSTSETVLAVLGDDASPSPQRLLEVAVAWCPATPGV